MSDKKVKLVIAPRDENTPGWYDYMEKLLKVQDLTSSKYPAERFEGFTLVIDIILDQVIEPDREEAKRLLTAPAPVGKSHSEIMALFGELTGQKSGKNKDEDPLA